MKKKILVLLLACSGLMGLASGFFAARDMMEPAWWRLTSALFMSVTIFSWYRVDSIEKGFRRPMWLSVGVVGIAPLAIPLYIALSTERGLRLRAFGRLLGFFCLLMFALLAADVVGTVIG